MAQVGRIKVYGERNTGTNLLERALGEATDLHIHPGNAPRWRMTAYHYARKLGVTAAAAEALDRLIEADRDRYFAGAGFARTLGWKHARTPPTAPPGFETPADLGYVTLRKNPYSWLLSLHKRAYAGRGRAARSAQTLTAFAATPWPTVRRECGPEIYPTPMAIWCDKVASYAALDALRPAVHLRYEDMLADPAEALRAIGVGLGVAVRPEAANFDTPTKGDPGSGDRYRAYYLEERWRAKLDPETVAAINAGLDAELVRRMGYAMIDPAEVAAQA